MASVRRAGATSSHGRRFVYEEGFWTPRRPAADRRFIGRNRYKWPTLALSFFAGMGAWVIYGSPEISAIRTTSWWGVLGYSSASAAGGWVLGARARREAQGRGDRFSAAISLRATGVALVMGVSTFYMFIYVGETDTIERVCYVCR